MMKMLTDALNAIPYVKRLLAEKDFYRNQLESRNLAPYLFVPPGHYYSPIPCLDEVRKDEERIFNVHPRSFPSIDLNEEGQIRMFREFSKYYSEIPFREKKTDGLRYYFDNQSYCHSDAVCLYSMIRLLKPGRIIEIGSGFSSCVTLDTNEIFFGNSIDCTFIEPYPELLLSLMKEEDTSRATIIDKRLQDVPVDTFSQLSNGDILFVDSTHVSRVFSDVNQIFFEILPRLASGVYIHFHDIFYPFEYPQNWIYEGKAWNEAYLLRSFLQFNSSFEIVFFNTFMEHFHQDMFEREMPLCMLNKGGSIWLKKR